MGASNVGLGRTAGIRVSSPNFRLWHKAVGWRIASYVSLTPSTRHPANAPTRETPAQAAGPASQNVADSHDTATAVVAGQSYRAVKVPLIGAPPH